MGNEISYIDQEKHVFLGDFKIKKIKPTSKTITKTIKMEGDLHHIARNRIKKSYENEEKNILDDDAFFSDVVDEFKIEFKYKKKIVDLEKEYRLYLDKLRSDVFDLNFLLKFNLQELDKLHKALELIKESLLDEGIIDGSAGDACDNIATTISKIIDSKVAIWPDDKKKGENSEMFLRRVWGDRIFCDNPILRSDLRKEPHYNLYKALKTHFSRNEVPEDLLVWWNKSPQRKKEEIDNILKNHNIKNPEDAYRRGLPDDEAQRLYNAAKSRLLSTK